MARTYIYSRDSKTKTQIGAVILSDTKNRAQEYAKTIDRSFNWVVEKALEEYLKNNADNT